MSDPDKEALTEKESDLIVNNDLINRNYMRWQLGKNPDPLKKKKKLFAGFNLKD